MHERGIADIEPPTFKKHSLVLVTDGKSDQSVILVDDVGGDIRLIHRFEKLPVADHECTRVTQLSGTRRCHLVIKRGHSSVGSIFV